MCRPGIVLGREDIVMNKTDDVLIDLIPRAGQRVLVRENGGLRRLPAPEHFPCGILGSEVGHKAR